jgi:hypothetical protein
MAQNEDPTRHLIDRAGYGLHVVPTNDHQRPDCERLGVWSSMLPPS